MKICVITATYPLEGFGGVFIKEQCEQLVSRGNEVVVLYCAGHLKSIHDTKVHQEISKGVRVLYNCVPRYATTHAPHFWSCIMKWQINALYKTLQTQSWIPDVLYAHFSFPAGRLALDIGQYTNIPVVVAEHWSGLINGKARGAVLRIINETISNVSSIICVSPALKDAVVSITNKSEGIHVIPNMLGSEFRFFPREKKDDFVFFSLGTLNGKKQFDGLIHAFSKAFRPEDNVRLRIGGSGPDEDKLRKLISDERREHQISLLGQLNRDETINEYALCDSFILLSPKETFGIVYREAMAIGRPIISLDNGGINYKWRDECGIIIKCSSDQIIEQTALAMRRMVEDIDSYNLMRISEISLEEFSPDKVSARIENVLKEVAHSD